MLWKRPAISWQLERANSRRGGAFASTTTSINAYLVILTGAITSLAPSSGTRVQPHGYEMKLSRSDWMERYAIHTGAFYSGEVTATVAALLRSGDCFVDVGANIGFVTLCASRIVGGHGQVIAFEPNPALVARLTCTLAHNRISNVTVLPFAAGDRTGDIGFSQEAHHGNNYVTEPAMAPR